MRPGQTPHTLFMTCVVRAEPFHESVDRVLGEDQERQPNKVGRNGPENEVWRYAGRLMPNRRISR